MTRNPHSGEQHDVRPARPRTSLFRKYFLTLFAAVVAPLLIAGGSEAWLGYYDERARLNDILNAEARLAAVKIEDFIDGIRDQLGAPGVAPVHYGDGFIEQHWLAFRRIAARLAGRRAGPSASDNSAAV